MPLRSKRLSHAPQPDLLPYQTQCHAGHLGHGLTNRRQGRPDSRRDWRVVKSGDAQISRDLDIQSVSHRDSGGGHVVIAGKNRGGSLFAPEQGLRGLDAGQIGVVATYHPLRANLQTRFTNGHLESLETTGAIELLGAPHDKAEVPMAERQEMTGHSLGGGDIVDEYRYRLRRLAGGAYTNHRQPNRLEPGVDGHGVAQRRGQQDTVNATLQQTVERR